MKMLGRLAAAVTASAICAACADAQDAAEVRVTIDRDAPGDAIEPEIYGHFAEHLGRSIYEGVWVGPDSDIPNTNGYRTDVVEALRALEVPVIRWPGGCFADEYHWRDGIGPREERPIRINTHWGWVQEDNSFGTHEFLDFVELIGSQAYVAGNMGSAAPVEMAQWVEYMTSPDDTTLTRERAANGRAEPWSVPFFGVGNESWGCGGNMAPDYSAQQHNRYATFIKTAPGIDIVKVATAGSDDQYYWTEAVVSAARGQTDAISLHYYTVAGPEWAIKGPATGFPVEEWASTIANARRLDEYIAGHIAVLDEHDPEGEIALYVDEWGNWYDPEPESTPGFLYQQSSIRDAVTAALTLNIFHRHTDRVKMANIAQMVNVLQASILTDGPRMLLTPTYHVLDMYKPFRGATPFPATVDGPSFTIGADELPHVDVSAAQRQDGALVLSLVNLHPEEPARVTTDLTGAASGRIITGPEMDTHNTFDAPNTIQPQPYAGVIEGGVLVFDLPAKSVAVVTVQ